jgi:phosphoribosylformylglycinamidine cyclo-ligase
VENGGLTYEQSGVSIDAQDQAIEGFREKVERSHGAAKQAGAGSVLAGVGSFGAAFRPNFQGAQQPVLISSTDGIGTKVKLHARFGTHEWAGRDLVAAVVNDVLCQGAQPLFFLDYLACNKVDPAVIEQVVGGMASQCSEIGCALVGGEIAEMGDTYRLGEYDLAGFAVGAVDGAAMWGAERVQEGDALIGVASSGVHCNGFSLVRRIFEQRPDPEWRAADPELGATLHDALLQPTLCYAGALATLRTAGKWDFIHAAAHISGGGLPGNLPRSIPEGLSAEVDRRLVRELAGETAAIFDIIERYGRVSVKEMWRVFNMGVGFVLLADEASAASIVELLVNSGFKARQIGTVTGSKDDTRLVWSN